MEAFLNRAHHAITDLSKDPRSTDVHVVIGNEAADLDSVVSSLVLGYLRYQQSQKTNSAAVIVPVINCPRQDLPLRTEVVYWLRKHIISPNWLTHIEDLTRWWIRAKGEQFHSFTVTLVDHNSLAGDLEFLIPYVDCIYDHHPLMPCAEGKIDELRRKGHLNWDLVGSCCTLIAKHYFDLTKSELTLTNEDQLTVLFLLYGVILLDTLCLDPQYERFLPLDEEMLLRIEEKLFLEKGARTTIFHELEEAKFDVSGLTNIELLRRDVKFIRPYIAMCSIAGVDYAELIRRPNLHNEIQEYCSLEAVGVAILLTLGGVHSRSEQLRRGIVLFQCQYNGGIDFFTQLQQHLRNDANLELSCYPSPAPRLVVFAQTNVKLSRKYILPMVAQFIEQWRSEHLPAIASHLPTPHNTPLDVSDEENECDQESRGNTQRHLPSFNNLATVQRVQAKRSNLQQEADEAIQRGADAQETFTPANSLTKEGLLARLLHKGPDTGRMQDYSSVESSVTGRVSQEISIEDAKLIAHNLVPAAIKVGLKRSVRNELENYMLTEQLTEHDVSEFTNEAALKLKLTPKNSDIDTEEGFTPSQTHARHRPFADAVMPRHIPKCLEPDEKDTAENAKRQELLVPNNHRKEDGSSRQGKRGKHSLVFSDEMVTFAFEKSPQSHDNSVSIAASTKVDIAKRKPEKVKDEHRARSPGQSDEGHSLQSDSLASSTFPEFLSSSDITQSEETDVTFYIDGKKESFHSQIIRDFEGAFRILDETMIIGSAPCKIALFFACLLPRNDNPFYENIMNTLYLYVIKSLQEICESDYVLVYVNCGVCNNQTPNFNWLKQCHSTLDKSVRKNIKKMFIVSPTFWTKALVFFFSCFISKRFTDKIEYIETLNDLRERVPQTATTEFPNACFEDEASFVPEIVEESLTGESAIFMP